MNAMTPIPSLIPENAPFSTEQRSWLNGFFVLDCKDRADAEAWAAKNPAAMFGGTIEVHPILTLM